MSKKKDKQETYVYAYTHEQLKMDNGDTIKSQKQREFEIKAEIRRVNAILRNKPSPHAYKQNKKYLERLERELRQCQRKRN